MALLFRYCSYFMFLLWLGGMFKFGIIVEVQMFLIIGVYGLVMDWRYRLAEQQQAAPVGSKLVLACSSNYGATMQQIAQSSGPRILADMEIRNETPELVRMISLGEACTEGRNSTKQPLPVVSPYKAA